MNRVEFIEGLKAALQNEMNEKNIQEHIKYYNSYIMNELQKGRLEQDIVNELGDPWIIARTLEEVKEEQPYEGDKTFEQTVDGTSESSQQTGKGYSRGKSVNVGCWMVVVIIFVVLFLLTGIVKILTPFLVPIVIITLFIKFFQKRS